MNKPLFNLKIQAITGIIFTMAASTSCSKNKDAGFIGSSSAPRLGAPAAAQDSIAQVPIQAAFMQTATPPPASFTTIPLVLPPPPAHISGLTLLPREMKSKTDSDILIGWVLPAEAENATNFTLRIFDNSKNLIFEKSGTTSDFGITGGYGFIWKTPTIDGFYEISVIGETADGKIIDSGTGNILVRGTAPLLRMYLGLQEQPDNCVSPTFSPGVVAASSLPFAFCTKEPETLDINGKDVSIGIAKLCFKTFTSQEANFNTPSDNDPCWTENNAVPASMLLQTGINEIVGFVKDNLGNIGYEKTNVSLEQGDAPRIDIMEPLSSSISSAPWKFIQDSPTIKTFRWKAMHKTTAFKDMRFIVTLMESVDQTKFKHLACNFKNDLVFKQCPSAEIENSPLIKPVKSYPTYPNGVNASGQGEGEAEFSFTIPPDWDSSKTYLLTVTGIDRAGNAAVASTQEINAGWEVIAGRTYDGLGSSGKNLRRSMQTTIIRTDKYGQLFDITNNIKFSAIDNRSCRLVRGIGAAPTPFDCEDIIESNDKIVNTEWAYSVDEHAFYTLTTDKKLIRINLKNRNTEVLLGAGSTFLSKDIAVESPAQDFKINVPNTSIPWIYYEKNSKLLFFIADNMLFSLDKNAKVTHVLGSGIGEVIPLSQINIAQKDLILPTNVRFVVTADKRILFATSNMPAGWTATDGRGIQYILQDFSFTNSATLINFERYSPDTPLPLPRDPSSALIRQGITMDENNQNIYAALSWWGFYKMKLPPKNSTLDKYVWEKISDNIGLVSSGPLAFIPKSNTLYYSDSDKGYIKSWDLDKNTIIHLVGFDIGKETTQLSQNRYLDTPRHAEVISDNEIIFSDYYNLQKTVKNTEGNWEISTIIPNFSRYKFRIIGDNLIQSRLNGLSIYSLSAAKGVTSVTNGTNSMYEIQQGFGNNQQNLKTANLHTNMATSYVNKGYLSLGEYTINGTLIPSKKHTPLINVFTLNTPQCGTGGTENCAQATLQKNAANVNFYNGSDYKMQQILGNYHLHHNLGSIAFDSTDRYIFTCLNDAFRLYDTVDKIAYPFSAKTTAIPSKTLSCSTQNSHFVFYKGVIYFNNNKVFYKLIKDNILTANSADFEEIIFPSPVFTAGGIYFGFSLSDNYIYYTDKNTGRVLRNKR